MVQLSLARYPPKSGAGTELLPVAAVEWAQLGRDRSADGQPLAASAQSDGTTLWTGALRLSTARLLKPYRLVIMEREQLQGGRTWPTPT